MNVDGLGPETPAGCGSSAPEPMSVLTSVNGMLTRGMRTPQPSACGMGAGAPE